MASLFEEPRKGSGRWAVQIHGFGRVRVGGSKSVAKKLFAEIEHIEELKKAGIPHDARAKRFLMDCSAKIKKRLVKIGLISAQRSPTVADLLEQFWQTASVKPRTESNYRLAFDDFSNCVDALQQVTEIKPADGMLFLKQLKENYAQETAARRFKVVRSLFHLAVRLGWISLNPFEDIKPGGKSGKKQTKDRAFFVTKKMFNAIVKELPTAEDRLIFALGRWAGIRIPSEAIVLKWDSVNWGRVPTMLIESPKTDQSRIVPIFPELMPFFSEAFEVAEDGAIFVCPSLRTRKKPRDYFCHRLKMATQAAGYTLWQKPFNNLRATRATEIEEEFGRKAESDWLGHGSDITLENYLMKTNEILLRAVGISKNEGEISKSPA